MKKELKIKTFLSYSHPDEEYVDAFIKHVTPLVNNNDIELWYDRKLIPGKDLQNNIDDKIETAEIICLFVSSHFLASNACISEKCRAFELLYAKNICVIPIIVSPCAWLDDIHMKANLALPTDGKPVTTHDNLESAWLDTYQGLRASIDYQRLIRKLSISQKFRTFLDDTDLLRNAHGQKEKVLLDDIYIYPKFEAYKSEGKLDADFISSDPAKDIIEQRKTLIAGENQSGKTSLCKKLFQDLLASRYIPVYVQDRVNGYQGKIQTHISKAFKEQYEGVNYEDIPSDRIIPILDDFHYAKHKDPLIEQLQDFTTHILVTDDIFNLNIKNELLVDNYTRLTIKEFKPSQRYELIRKWISINEDPLSLPINDNDTYHELDSRVEFLEATLGKVIGKGILPAYPFFILSIISTHDTFEKPLDQEITSQGYCYQALIYMYLRKHGVKNEHVDTYLNFLSEFAYSLFQKKQRRLNSDEFESFFTRYKELFNMPVRGDILIKTLEEVQIIERSSLSEYSFKHDYLYYFFAARHISDHTGDCVNDITRIMGNLHKNENAYIAIFITHHTKKAEILDEIVVNALCLFDKHEPARLDTTEISFFDLEMNQIIQEVLPVASETPEMTRQTQLAEQDLKEETQNGDEVEEGQSNKDDEEPTDSDSILARDLRRSIKTVEVMGRIIKNRSGSMRMDRLEQIFKEAMEVHLRILSSYLALIQEREGQEEIVEFLTSRIEQIIETANKKKKAKKDSLSDKPTKPAKANRTNRPNLSENPSRDEIRKMAKKLFWNINFMVVYGTIKKIVHSIGSENLIPVAVSVCDRSNTPASTLVKHGIVMWYRKNLRVDEIIKAMESKDFSETAKKVMRYQVVNHCSMHSIDYKDSQRISDKMGIPTKRLLLEQVKGAD